MLKTSKPAKERKERYEKKEKLFSIIGGATMLLVSVFCFIIVTVIVPSAKYKKALQYYNEGNNYEACLILKNIDNSYGEYKESKDYISKINDIVIPEGVKEIKNSLFEGCKPLKTVVIPNTVTKIGDKAFLGCNQIQKIVIPESVKSIGEKAFSGCNALTEIVIEGDIEYVGKDAFTGCAFTTVTIPTNVITSLPISKIRTVVFNGGETVPDNALKNSTRLESVTFNDGLKNIGASAFENCKKLTSITFPSSLETIGANAFEGCTGFKSITLPSSLKEVGEWAFNNCYGIENVNFNEGLKTIAQSAFFNCKGLTSIKLPRSLTAIGEDAFRGCVKLVELYNLSNLNVAKGKETFGCVGYYALDVHQNATDASNISVKDNFLFYDNGNVHYLLAYKGSNSTVTLPTYEYKYSVIGCAFYGDSVVKNLTITTGVNEILPNAFSNSAITNAQLGEGLIRLSMSAFEDATSLKEVVIPESITYIEEKAFSGCTSLETINIGENIERIGSQAFAKCTGVKNFIMNYETPYVATDAFTGISVINADVIPETLKYVPLGKLESITYRGGDIEKEVFNGSKTLENVTLIDVSNIGEKAFLNCKKLSKVNIIATEVNKVRQSVLEYVGADAFKGTAITELQAPISFLDDITVDSLVKVSLYADVNGTDVVKSAFEGCDKLKEATLAEGITKIGENAFNGCSSLTAIVIPNSVTEIGNCAFDTCSKMTSITLGTGLEKIGMAAFWGCKELTTITIPENVISLGDTVFYGCDNLTEIKFLGTEEQWGNIEKGSLWKTGLNNVEKIICAGDVEVNI
ncbi:MAG: leucine-rich repeat domain-containing protein [Clostridia bacterium]|nr:leucine-rich repeat domain-containing protein [Clostridia bacterium]